MKDIVITGATLRRELRILLGCFIFAVLFDLFSIVKFHRPFTEIFTTIGYEIVIAVVVYLILALIRLIVFLIRKVLTKNNNK